MKRLLLTGFDAVNGDPTNPSAVIASKIGELWQSEIATAIIPTSYERSWPALFDLLKSHNPNYVVMLGVAGRPKINIELRAQNRSSTERKDNDKQVGEPQIITAGPENYPTTLPVDEITKVLDSENLAYKLSNDAGDYLCNYIFYMMQHHAVANDLTLKSGFIHVPSRKALRGGDPTSSDGEAYRAVKAITEYLINFTA